MSKAKPNDPADAELVKKFREGSQAALSILFMRHKGRANHRLKQYIHDESSRQDIIQNAWIKAYPQLVWGNYDKEGTFWAWLWRIIFHEMINHIRRNKNHLHACEITDDLSALSVANSADEKMQREDWIYEVTKRMNEPMKTIVTMWIRTGDKHHEIASALGMDTDAVSQNISRAKRNYFPLIGLKELGL